MRKLSIFILIMSIMLSFFGTISVRAAEDLAGTKVNLYSYIEYEYKYADADTNDVKITSVKELDTFIQNCQYVYHGLSENIRDDYDASFFENNFLFLHFLSNPSYDKEYTIESARAENGRVDININISLWDERYLMPAASPSFLIFTFDRSLLDYDVLITERNINTYMTGFPGIEVDGRFIRSSYIDQMPTIINGRTFVSVHGMVLEQMGFTVNYWGFDVGIWQASLQYAGYTIIFTQDAPTFIVNGREYDLDVPAQMYNDFMLPFRAVCESVGLDVDWDAERNAVIITTPEGK
ncbi:MAG: copper amine oxidase N-terminal domain-containing protein [Oscillospiraceae bacterium]|nr:copper amine oxidase N-terminal domain-containing protein [Oscillospiraceae bacterium]